MLPLVERTLLALGLGAIPATRTPNMLKSLLLPITVTNLSPSLLVRTNCIRLQKQYPKPVSKPNLLLQRNPTPPQGTLETNAVGIRKITMGDSINPTATDNAKSPAPNTLSPQGNASRAALRRPDSPPETNLVKTVNLSSSVISPALNFSTTSKPLKPWPPNSLVMWGLQSISIRSTDAL